MKKIILPALALALITGCQSTQKTAEDESATARTDSVLINRLKNLQAEKKIAIGHHDDPAYGHSWEYVADSSDVKNVVGDYPAIFDWDLGLIEWDTDKQLDGVPFEFIREQVKAQDAAGGINSFSWHVRNPLGGDSWNVNDGASVGAVAACIEEGNPLNDTIKVWLGRTADFIGSLKDDAGQRIPIIFRPWHENTGTWFWWGTQDVSPEQYKALWRLTRQVFDEKGIDNVVWAYGPGTEPKSVEDYMVYYPGDDLIDIVGVDSYYFGGPENVERWQESNRASLDIITKVAQEHNKIPAFTETGYESIPIPDWYTNVLYPVIKEYPIAYVVFWRNASDKPNHYYTPYPGHPAAADFVEFYNKPETAFRGDLKK